jgi:glutamyl endopeptidase
MQLKPIRKPQPAMGLEAMEADEAPEQSRTLEGSQGSDTQEWSRSLEHVAVKGKSDVPLATPGGALESVIEVDERVRILDTDLLPWRMICALRVRGSNGKTIIGTGWFVGPRTLLTAGHCVFSTPLLGGWADTVEVSPGRNGTAFPYGTVKTKRVSSVDRWVDKEDADFDIGCIHLEEPLGEKTGWFSVGSLAPNELEGYLVNVSGYPSDRGMGTEQYHHRNRVKGVTGRRVFYDVDTAGGQSGAPVWIHKTPTDPPLAVAIHAYGTGGTPAELMIVANSAPRIIPEVLDQIEAWIKEDGGL